MISYASFIKLDCFMLQLIKIITEISAIRARITDISAHKSVNERNFNTPGTVKFKLKLGIQKLSCSFC